MLLSLSLTIRLLPVSPGVLLTVNIVCLRVDLAEARVRNTYLILGKDLIIQPILLFLNYHPLLWANFVEALSRRLVLLHHCLCVQIIRGCRILK